MPASTTFENLLLQHILQNANIANIGDATGLRGSTTTGSLYISLHIQLIQMQEISLLMKQLTQATQDKLL